MAERTVPPGNGPTASLNLGIQAQRLRLSRDALGLTFSSVEAFEAEAERLIQTTLTDAEFDALIAATFETVEADATERARQADRERREVLSFLFHDADTPSGIRGTAWAGYQAVAEYVDHYAPVRAKQDDAMARAKYAREHLAPYLRVRRIAFFELPKTISGKIRRVELRGREYDLAAGSAQFADGAREWKDEDFLSLREVEPRRPRADRAAGDAGPRPVRSGPGMTTAPATGGTLLPESRFRNFFVANTVSQLATGCPASPSR